ncbi:hypothetical protein AB5I41_31340 [Sphingomonas sp. MMS24-JH45]
MTTATPPAAPSIAASSSRAPTGISDDQRNILMTLAEQSGADMKGFCTFFRIASLPELAAADFAKAKAMLEQKLKAKAQPDREAA